jgi:hypothetical protein
VTVQLQGDLNLMGCYYYPFLYRWGKAAAAATNSTGITMQTKNSIMIKIDESTFNACHGGKKRFPSFNISKNLTKYSGCS